eukprot:TRINITY_DN1536_c4_g1_i1.p1 TRINITY_DN1536_c4_g1~~TRINITY_DN1536_c4_g1_i1.p1  ORF type:complete len:507 (-),score=142.40 TRINITY_DN1536_c4_g1_i1:22-1542(-)
MTQNISSSHQYDLSWQDRTRKSSKKKSEEKTNGKTRDEKKEKLSGKKEPMKDAKSTPSGKSSKSARAANQAIYSPSLELENQIVGEEMIPKSIWSEFVTEALWQLSQIPQKERLKHGLTMSRIDKNGPNGEMFLCFFVEGPFKPTRDADGTTWKPSRKMELYTRRGKSINRYFYSPDQTAFRYSRVTKWLVNTPEVVYFEYQHLDSDRLEYQTQWISTRGKVNLAHFFSFCAPRMLGNVSNFKKFLNEGAAHNIDRPNKRTGKKQKRKSNGGFKVKIDSNGTLPVFEKELRDRSSKKHPSDSEDSEESGSEEDEYENEIDEEVEVEEVEDEWRDTPHRQKEIRQLIEEKKQMEMTHKDEKNQVSEHKNQLPSTRQRNKTAENGGNSHKDGEEPDKLNKKRNVVKEETQIVVPPAKKTKKAESPDLKRTNKPRKDSILRDIRRKERLEKLSQISNWSHEAIIATIELSKSDEETTDPEQENRSKIYSYEIFNDDETESEEEEEPQNY